VATNALSFANYLLLLRSLTRSRSGSDHQRLHRQRDLFLPRGAPACVACRTRYPAGDRSRIAARRQGAHLVDALLDGRGAYSIALWLLENWPMVDAYNIEIVGSDIDGDAVAAAREGTVRRPLAEPSCRTSPSSTPISSRPNADRSKIIDDLRESVRFTAGNLIDACER
jgi:hypothetical protein